MKQTIIIGTAGHIDHGKTSLVKALTGVDTDRLPEEKERGITIDLGFAHWDLGEIEISFIDVPGHERFVRNTLAGIGGIDLLLLVVAADESVMPQTREHFDICRLLGIPAGVAVLTKKDLVDTETLELVKQDVRELTAGSFLEDAPFYAVSSRTGDGSDALKQGLLENIQHPAPRASSSVLRLPVDRVFTLKGHGTVITGTLIGGHLNREQPVEILPTHRKSRVRSIHAHDRSVEQAVAGQRTAVNLMALEKDEIERGHILTEPDIFKVSSLLDVKITLLPGARPIEHNALVHFHHQATDVQARVTLLGQERLDSGESAFAQLRLQRPVFALYNDRFILRRQSPPVTIGGGIIVDHLPRKRVRRTDAVSLRRMRALQNADAAERCSIHVALRGILGADEKYLRAAIAMDTNSIRMLNPPDTHRLREQPLLLISSEAESRILQRLNDAIAAFHKKNPLLPGISKEELRTKYLSSVPPEVFAACLERSVAAKSIQLVKDVVAVAGHRVSLSREEEDLTGRVERALLAAGLEFPGFDALSKATGEKMDEVKKIAYLLVRQANAVKITEDYFLHRRVWDELKQKVRSLKSSQSTFSVPDFKDKFGVSRKFAIPLLEQLDREGVTRRKGNERIIL